MTPPPDLLLLWHMHQPRYVHPVSGDVILPWVRLHAASGYLDMARVLERHPGARVTVNFVPSLVEQIESTLAGTRDQLERIAEKPAAELTPDEARVVMSRCFSVRWDRIIDPRPRYAELLARRDVPRPTARDLRDVQCLFLLGWLGFAAREDDPGIDALDAKGRDYGEDDKAYLLAATRRAVAAVLPAWGRLADRGQAELCTSPYYHPIVPLLVDTEVARRSRPGDALPPRMRRPEDAREQIRRARESHRRTFGRDPAGMWPSEGSLSPEAVALYHEHGIGWLAGDEETLARSLAHVPDAPPYEAARGAFWRHEGVDLVFRDRELSDRIGFKYADLPAEHAAADLIATARQRAAAGASGLIGVFLDGENAWESYPGRGREFLEALYRGLEDEARAGRLQARTISEAREARGAGRPLQNLHSGSWIEASFRIWIGDPDKNRAWALLARVRERLAVAEANRPAGDPGIERARTLLLAAEGSDWFWWFGEPFSSAEDPVFDELFRSHLVAALAALGEPVPSELDEPIGQGRVATHTAAPTALIHPHLDGTAARFYEWQGAGSWDVGRGGAMADASHPIHRVWVGFDEHTLYLRLDPLSWARRQVAGARLWLTVRRHPAGGGEPVETRLAVQLGAADGGPALRAMSGRVAALEVAEVAIPFAALRAAPRDELRLAASLEFAGVPFGRVPRDGFLSVTVPWHGWSDEHWSA